MKDDYTIDSHYLTYTFLFRKVGRMYILNLGVKGVKSTQWTPIITSCRSRHFLGRFISSLSVPIVAPLNVSVKAITTTSVRVWWAFNSSTRNVLGVLVGFRVYYVLSEGHSTLIQDRYHETTNTTLITGLQVFAMYNVSVAARTSKGPGPASPVSLVKTKAGGKTTTISERSLILTENQ